MNLEYWQFFDTKLKKRPPAERWTISHQDRPTGTSRIDFRSFGHKIFDVARVFLCLLSIWHNIQQWLNDLVKTSFNMGPYNRLCIAASRQPNFYLLRRHGAPQYRLEIVFPGSRETPAVIQKFLYLWVTTK